MAADGGHVRRVLTTTAGEAGAGALAGAVATLPMSGLMLLPQRLGLMGTQPPRRISDTALEVVGADPAEPGRRLLAAVSQVSFGGEGCAPSALLHRAVPAVGPAAHRPPGTVEAVLVTAREPAGDRLRV